ncbi:MAG: universal stress protein [Anaerolineaceae bacterium]
MTFDSVTQSDYSQAVNDFHHARDLAALEQISSHLRGKSADLLSFDDVVHKLHISGGSDRGLQDIPIKSIVGSVGRYTDFTRSFLPRHQSDAERWARVKSIIVKPGAPGLEPIQVYKIGEAYFVRDGHHRVSVARRLGAKYIQAYVIEVKTKVPLTADVTPDELIIKAEQADLLNETHLDEILPDVKIEVTVPGGYPRLYEHIRVHHYFMGIDLKRDVTMDEAVLHWYETVYLPVVNIIRERGVLREFPGRTEADLYLWISEHREYIQHELGWQIRPEMAAKNFVREMSPRLIWELRRITSNLLDRLIPDALEPSFQSGEWVKEKRKHRDTLFVDLLVGVRGGDSGWSAVEQAIVLAQREHGQIHGLHMSDEDVEPQDEAAVREHFDAMCRDGGVEGSLAVASGEVARVVCERAVFNDLVILNMTYPPAQQMIAKMTSGFHTILRRCPCPVLAVPDVCTTVDRLLLAFDGSEKSREALFVSVYYARKYHYDLCVLTVMDTEQKARKILAQAERYLKKHRTEARYLARTGNTQQVIIQTAKEQGSNMILMGGYGSGPVVEMFVDSTVDRVLRETRVPVLICQS